MLYCVGYLPNILFINTMYKMNTISLKFRKKQRIGLLGNGAGYKTFKGKGLKFTARAQRLGGTAECECPKCGYKEPHIRGIPCSQTKCPKCDTPMQRAFCRLRSQ